GDGIRDRNVTGVQTCALPICLDDLLVVGLGGVDVVVVGVDPCGLQPPGLPVLQDAQAGADLDARMLALEGAGDARHAVDVPIQRSPTTGHEAHPRRAAVDAGAGLLEGLLGAQPGVAQDRGRRSERLGAVRAVLLAQSRFQVHQVVQLHAVPEACAAPPAGGLHEVEQLRLRRLQDGECLLLAQLPAGQHVGGELVDVAHQRCPRRSWASRREVTAQKEGSRTGSARALSASPRRNGATPGRNAGRRSRPSEPDSQAPPHRYSTRVPSAARAKVVTGLRSARRRASWPAMNAASTYPTTYPKVGSMTPDWPSEKIGAPTAPRSR